MDKQRRPSSREHAKNPETDDDTPEGNEEQPNPPRTSTEHWTSPKFGSAGSGGAELEPGPERD